jgi:hypothetical protein
LPVGQDRVETTQFLGAVDERVHIGGKLSRSGTSPFRRRPLVEVDASRDVSGLDDIAGRPGQVVP